MKHKQIHKMKIINAYGHPLKEKHRINDMEASHETSKDHVKQAQNLAKWE